MSLTKSQILESKKKDFRGEWAYGVDDGYSPWGNVCESTKGGMKSKQEVYSPLVV